MFDSDCRWKFKSILRSDAVLRTCLHYFCSRRLLKIEHFFEKLSNAACRTPSLIGTLCANPVRSPNWAGLIGT
jgi:hypothetical protein